MSNFNYIETGTGVNVKAWTKGVLFEEEAQAQVRKMASLPFVRGLGNPDSFDSCSHGAGRTMSRTAAKKLFTVEDHKKATEGIECRKDEDVIDEIPACYKDIQAVMDAQSDLIEIVHTLKQVVVVKG